MSLNGQFEIPEVCSFEQIYERVRGQAAIGVRPRAALVVPSDSVTLNSFARAIKELLLEPFIIGDEDLARRKAEEAGVDIGEARFLDVREPELAVQAAAKMAAAGEIDFMIKGRIPTISFLRLLLEKDSMFRLAPRRISHVTVMRPSLYAKLLFLTDAAINIEPDLKTKLELIENAVEVALRLGVAMPRVAVLAAVEVVYPQMPVTTDAAIIAKMADRKQIKNAFVDGPLSFDTAVDRVAAEAKGLTQSPVAGQADILLAPNIETANGVYKAMSLYGNAEIGILIWGCKVPVVLSSRSDSAANRFNALLLGLLAVGNRSCHSDD